MTTDISPIGLDDGDVGYTLISSNPTSYIDLHDTSLQDKRLLSDNLNEVGELTQG